MNNKMNSTNVVADITREVSPGENGGIAAMKNCAVLTVTATNFFLPGRES